VKKYPKCGPTHFFKIITLHTLTVLFAQKLGLFGNFYKTAQSKQYLYQPGNPAHEGNN
jgi:hypothetical protein